MADASTIGASFSNYRGDPALGGGGLGAVRIDTQPVDDWAKYTMLYNKAVWDQNQKDVEKAADELGSFASLDLSTTIPKDAKILQDKYDQLYQWAQQNPDALNYKSGKYLEYRKRKADLMNDIAFAKKNSLINESRKKAIADEPNENNKKVLEQMLQGEIENKGIRDTLNWAPKFDTKVPDWGQNSGKSLTIRVKEPNQDVFLDHDIFDVEQADKAGAAFTVGLGSIDQRTTGGQIKTNVLGENSLLKGADIYNQTLGQLSSTIDPNLSAADKTQALRKELNRNGITRGLLDGFDQYNNYVASIRDQILKNPNNYTDKFGKRLNPDLYSAINWQDGISPDEISKLAQFLGWKGDKMGIKEVQTNDEIERQRLALGWANLNLDKQKFAESTSTQQLGAASVLAAIQNALKTGTRRQLTDNVITTTKDKDGKVIDRKVTGQNPGDQVIEIADGALLKQYATVSKDGTTTIPPDRFFYNPSKKTMTVVYYDRDKNGDIRESSGGGPVVKDQIPISVDDWMANLTGVRFTGDDKGKVNNLVSTVIRNGFNYDLEKFANEYGGVSPVSTEGTQKKSSSSSSGKYDKYKRQ